MAALTVELATMRKPDVALEVNTVPTATPAAVIPSALAAIEDNSRRQICGLCCCTRQGSIIAGAVIVVGAIVGVVLTLFLK